MFTRTKFYYNYTVSQKKVPTFKLSAALSNLNGFSKFLHCWKLYEICYKTHMTSPTSPQACCYNTLGNKKFKFLQIFSRYEENANKLHLITSNFVIHPQILIFLLLENGVPFPILTANKIFHVTVLLVIYFCGQFVLSLIHI